MPEDGPTRAEAKRAWVRSQIARAEALLANPHLPDEMRPKLERWVNNFRQNGQPTANQAPSIAPEAKSGEAGSGARAAPTLAPEAVPVDPAPQHVSRGLRARLAFCGRILLAFLAFGLFGWLMGWDRSHSPDCYYYSAAATDC